MAECFASIGGTAQSRAATWEFPEMHTHKEESSHKLKAVGL
jgi:hypothetical protein